MSWRFSCCKLCPCAYCISTDRIDLLVGGKIWECRCQFDFLTGCSSACVNRLGNWNSQARPTIILVNAARVDVLELVTGTTKRLLRKRDGGKEKWKKSKATKRFFLFTHYLPLALETMLFSQPRSNLLVLLMSCGSVINCFFLSYQFAFQIDCLFEAGHINLYCLPLLWGLEKVITSCTRICIFHNQLGVTVVKILLKYLEYIAMYYFLLIQWTRTLFDHLAGGFVTIKV